MINIYKFKYNDRLYIVDLDGFRLVEVNQIVWEAVELSSTLEAEALIDHLSENYPRESVTESLEWLANFQRDKVVSQNRVWESPLGKKDNRLRIYVPQGKNEWFSDLESISAGTNVALYHTTQSLSKFADIYLSGETETEIAPGIYTIRLSVNDLQESPSRFNQRLKTVRGERNFGVSKPSHV